MDLHLGKNFWASSQVANNDLHPLVTESGVLPLIDIQQEWADH